MNGRGIALWRELLSQFLLTFSLLSTVGVGVWVVGAGWSYFRRPRHRPCITPVDGPPHRDHSPHGTVSRPLGLYQKGRKAGDGVGMANSHAQARGGHI